MHNVVGICHKFEARKLFNFSHIIKSYLIHSDFNFPFSTIKISHKKAESISAWFLNSSKFNGSSEWKHFFSIRRFVFFFFELILRKRTKSFIWCFQKHWSDWILNFNFFDLYLPSEELRLCFRTFLYQQFGNCKIQFIGLIEAKNQKLIFGCWAQILLN